MNLSDMTELDLEEGEIFEASLSHGTVTTIEPLMKHSNESYYNLNYDRPMQTSELLDNFDHLSSKKYLIPESGSISHSTSETVFSSLVSVTKSHNSNINGRSSVFSTDPEQSTLYASELPNTHAVSTAPISEHSNSGAEVKNYMNSKHGFQSDNNLQFSNLNVLPYNFPTVNQSSPTESTSVGLSRFNEILHETLDHATSFSNVLSQPSVDRTNELISGNVALETMPTSGFNSISNSSDLDLKLQSLLSQLLQLMSENPETEMDLSENKVRKTEEKVGDLTRNDNILELIQNFSTNHNLDPSQVADAVSLVMEVISFSHQSSPPEAPSDSVNLQDTVPISHSLQQSSPLSPVSRECSSSLSSSSKLPQVERLGNLETAGASCLPRPSSSSTPKTFQSLNENVISKQSEQKLQRLFLPTSSQPSLLSENVKTQSVGHMNMFYKKELIPPSKLTTKTVDHSSISTTPKLFASENLTSDSSMNNNSHNNNNTNLGFNKKNSADKYKLEFITPAPPRPLQPENIFQREKWLREKPRMIGRDVNFLPFHDDMMMLHHGKKLMKGLDGGNTPAFLKGNQYPLSGRKPRHEEILLFHLNRRMEEQKREQLLNLKPQNSKYFAPSFHLPQSIAQGVQKPKGLEEKVVEVGYGAENKSSNKKIVKMETNVEKDAKTNKTISSSETLSKIKAERMLLLEQMKIFKEEYEKKKKRTVCNLKEEQSTKKVVDKQEKGITSSIGGMKEKEEGSGSERLKAVMGEKKNLSDNVPSVIASMPIQVIDVESNSFQKKRKIDQCKVNDLLQHRHIKNHKREGERMSGKGKRNENDHGNDVFKTQKEGVQANLNRVLPNSREILLKTSLKKEMELEKGKKTEAAESGSVAKSERRSSGLEMKMRDEEEEFANLYLKGLGEEEKNIILIERERRRNEHEKMLKESKLCLVLDLDHTLLNSAKYNDIRPELQTKLMSALAIEMEKEQRGNGKKYRRELYTIPSLSMWTKLRPGIWKFLHMVSKWFELHVYTMGNQAYASEITKILDPSGKLFSGRVISRGDELRDLVMKEWKEKMLKKGKTGKKKQTKSMSADTNGKHSAQERWKEKEKKGKENAEWDDYEVNADGFLVKGDDCRVELNETEEEELEEVKEMSEIKLFKDLDGVLGLESGVLIIDDSASVWPHHAANLIVVERYMYFPFSRKHYGMAGPSFLEAALDERESDGMLASALSFIENIHSAFFAKYKQTKEGDVRETLLEQQKKILVGCRIVFSGLIPVGESNPSSYPPWKLAEQCGATCTMKLDEHVTHVIAASPGTEKVNWAINNKKFVVKTSWLEASSTLYKRANEEDFRLVPAK